MFKNLRAELARSGLKTIDLANYINVSPKTVRNKLNGVSEFTLSEITKIAELFPGLEISYLFDKADNSQRSA